MNGGWIKIHRKLLEWEWYDDVPTKVAWLHLLLTANWEDKEWHGITIARGQRFCSVATLAEETGLSTRNVRTAIQHLTQTNEIEIQETNNGTLVTLAKYAEYQDERQTTDKQSDKQSDKQTTNQTTNQKEGITAGIQLAEMASRQTNCQASDKPSDKQSDNNIRNIRNKEIKNISSSSSLSLNTTNYIEDEDAKAVFAEWDKARCCLSSQAEWERIGDLYDQYGKEAMLRAIRAAVDHGAVSIAYIKAVLRGKNYDLTEEEKRQNMREWLNG